MKIDLNTLSKLHLLNVRTYNVCIGNKLLDLNTIIDFYFKQGSFLDLKNSGKKTNEELTSICNFYIDENFSEETLGSLYYKQQISENSLEILTRNEIDSIQDFALFFATNIDFLPLDLKRIGYKYLFLNKGKIGANKFIEIVGNSSKPKTLKLKSLIEKKRIGLSRRSFNIINEVIDEIDHSPYAIFKYENDSAILSLKNSGKKSLKELSPFFKEIISIARKSLFSSNEEKEIASFGLKIPYIIALLKNKSRNLSQRSINIIDRVIKEIEEYPYAIFKYENDSAILSLKNSGKKSLKELSPFFKDIISIIRKLELQEKDKRQENNSFLQKKSNKYIEWRKNIDKEEEEFNLDYRIYQIENELGYEPSIFSDWLKINKLTLDSILPTLILVEFHLKQRLDERELEIMIVYFSNRGKYDSKIVHKLENKFSISHERIRQIRNNAVVKVINEVQKLKEVIEKTKLTIKEYPENKIFLFSINEIKESKDISLPENIIFKSLVILNNKFALAINDKRKHRYKYIIPKQVANSIDIQKMFHDIKIKVDSKIENDYKISLKPFLEEYKVSPLLDDNYEKVRIILTKLIYERFKLSVIDGNIFFKRNTPKKVCDYIFEILERKNKPMHIDEIVPFINFYYKNKPKKSESIRSQLLKYPDLFINTAWSTYGLKKWEDEGRYVGGTIKQVIEKYLNQFDVPKHFYEISQYVLKHRETTSESIRGNIGLDPRKIFRVFDGGFVGLTSKKYTETSFNIVSNKWFDVLIRDFIVNGRSQITADEISKRLALKLNVIPIQITALLNERIEKRELQIDANNFLVLFKDGIHSVENLTEFTLPPNILRMIRLKLKNDKHLEALNFCMKSFKERGIKISISKAKIIIDKELNRINN